MITYIKGRDEDSWMNKKQLFMVTLALLLANIMSGLDATIINTAIPAIVSDLHGIQYMGWIVACFLLGMSVSVPIWGKLGERMGNKFAFELSLALFILGSLLEGIDLDIYFFLIARILMGVGAGGMGSLPYVIVGYIYPNIKRRTVILGYIAASFSAASIAGPLVGGWIVDTLSWHWVFYINVPLGLIAIILSFVYYKGIRKPNKNTQFDKLGAFTLIAGLTSFLIGIQLLGMVSLPVVLGFIILSILLLVVFIRAERKAKSPVVPLSVFTNKALVGDFLIFALAWGSSIAVNTYLPMWAQTILGASALVGGMTLIPNSIVDIVGSQTAPYFLRHVNNYRLLIANLTIMAITAVGLIFAPISTPYQILALIAAFSGFGVGSIFVILQIKVQVDASEKDMAPATSLSFLIRILALTIMAAIYGVIMNLALGRGIAGHPGITMTMMNKLSDAESAKSLPVQLLPTMRKIFYGGIREIMIVSLVLLVAAYVVNYLYNRHEAKIMAE